MCKHIYTILTSCDTLRDNQLWSSLHHISHNTEEFLTQDYTIPSTFSTIKSCRYISCEVMNTVDLRRLHYKAWLGTIWLSRHCHCCRVRDITCVREYVIHFVMFPYSISSILNDSHTKSSPLLSCRAVDMVSWKLNIVLGHTWQHGLSFLIILNFL